MPAPRAGVSIRLPQPPATYDPRDQAAFRQEVIDALHKMPSIPEQFTISVKDVRFGAKGDGTTDDTVAIQAAHDYLYDLGGGELFFPPGRYLLTADINIKRLVHVRGCGSGASILYAASEVNFAIVGAEDNWGHTVHLLGFDGVRPAYGMNVGDFANGCVIADFEVRNCVNGLYLGQHNVFMMDIERPKIHDCTNAIYFDKPGPAMNIFGGGLFDCDVLIYVNSNSADGHDIKVFGTDLEHCTVAALKTVSSGEGTISLIGVHLELNTGAQIVQDGSTIFLGPFWSLSGSETHFIETASGRTFIERGRMSFPGGGNYFCKMTGGDLFIDSGTVFCAGRWFGEGNTVFADPASSAGNVYTSRDVYAAQMNQSHTYTNASPGPTTLATLQAYDSNQRVWEFDVVVTIGAATDNKLRIDLNPGGTCRLDLDFSDLHSGFGHVRITYTPGGEFEAVGWFIGSTGVAKAVHAVSTDTNGHTAQRTLELSSIKIGATAAQIEISNLCEYASGPKITGM